MDTSSGDSSSSGKTVLPLATNESSSSSSLSSPHNTTTNSTTDSDESSSSSEELNSTNSTNSTGRRLLALQKTTPRGLSSSSEKIDVTLTVYFPNDATRKARKGLLTADALNKIITGAKVSDFKEGESAEVGAPEEQTETFQMTVASTITLPLTGTDTEDVLKALEAEVEKQYNSDDSRKRLADSLQVPVKSLGTVEADVRFDKKQRRLSERRLSNVQYEMTVDLKFDVSTDGQSASDKARINMALKNKESAMTRLKTSSFNEGTTTALVQKAAEEVKKIEAYKEKIGDITTIHATAPTVSATSPQKSTSAAASTDLFAALAFVAGMTTMFF